MKQARSIPNPGEWPPCWDVAGCREPHYLLGHEDAVWGVEFSPDGRRIATASRDRSIRLWDAATGQELLFLFWHEGAVRGLANSLDGWTLASGGENQTVKTWEAAPSTRIGASGPRGLGPGRARLRAANDGNSHPGAHPQRSHTRRRGSQAPLALAEPYEQILEAREAERAVLACVHAGLFRPELLASLRGDPAFSQSVRRCACTWQRHIPEDPRRLGAASWSVGHRSMPNRPRINERGSRRGSPAG